MDKQFDVVIVGAGISGLLTAYKIKSEIKEGERDISIAILEKGHSLEKRVCPASSGKPCANCKVCSITSGLAGAGAFSDGKFNLGTSYGGNLGSILGEDIAMKYINETYDILSQFITKEMNIKIYENDSELTKKCLQNNLQLLDMKVAHLGTDNNYKIMEGLIKWLKKHNVKIFEDTEVIDVKKSERSNKLNKFAKYCIYTGKNKYYTDLLVLATGRSGAKFIEKIVKDFSIKYTTNKIDIGVRVEMDDKIWEEFSNKIYEPKIIYKTKTFEDTTRMFCFNKGGIITTEKNDDIITVNGHSFADPEKKTKNCNFAILSSIEFTEPFNKPTEYAQSYAKIANMIGEKNILVQRFGDLKHGRRTTTTRLEKNSVKPTAKATPGDLSLVLPHRILTNIIETIEALDKVAPGTANPDTLIYGIEAKYYSMKPYSSVSKSPMDLSELNENNKFMIDDGLYLIGDGSGKTRGLSQAGASGLIVGKLILDQRTFDDISPIRNFLQ